VRAPFRLLYRGKFYEIWLAQQEGGCQVTEFLGTRSDEVNKRIFAIVRKTADVGKYEEEEIYRHIGQGIWEFKARTVRLYAFSDGKQIILTHCGLKPKSVNNDRDKAMRVRDGWEAWKERR
jgi:putative component of toxin-antitoxin plasmid stabilization module